MRFALLTTLLFFSFSGHTRNHRPFVEPIESLVGQRVILNSDYKMAFEPNFYPSLRQYFGISTLEVSPSCIFTEGSTAVVREVVPATAEPSNAYIAVVELKDSPGCTTEFPFDKVKSWSSGFPESYFIVKHPKVQSLIAVFGLGY